MSINRLLLDTYLKTLRLHTFSQYYEAFAQDATHNILSPAIKAPQKTG